MSKQTMYHVSDKGIGVCGVTTGTCPYLRKFGEGSHSTDVFEVNEFFRTINDFSTVQTLKKTTDKRTAVSGNSHAAQTIRNAVEGGVGRLNKGDEPASQNQFDFIKTLRIERVVPDAVHQEMMKKWNNGEFTHAEAFKYIQLLQNFVQRPEAVKFNTEMVGYHQTKNGTIIQVNRSKNGYMHLHEIRFSPDGSQFMKQQVAVETLADLSKDSLLDQPNAIALDRTLVKIAAKR